MRILVFGAGAVGGYLGGILTVAGEDVTLVARGAQYEALAKRGLTLEGPKSGRPEPIAVRAARPGEEQGTFDLIFVTLKSHQLAPVAAHITKLLAPGGSMVFPQNGLPWWYFDKTGGRYSGTRLASVDADGTLARTFPLDAVIGAVTYKPADLAEPGRIRLSDGDTDKLVIGELDNQVTPRLKAIGAILDRAGWPGAINTDIRKAKWSKLLSNAVWNTLGALTQSTAKEVALYAPTRPIAATLMSEVMAVASAVGVELGVDPVKTVADAGNRVSILSSTLQDVRGGRPLEIDAIVHSVLEVARLTGVKTPTLDVIAACVGLINQHIVEERVAIAPRPLASQTPNFNQSSQGA